MPDLNSVSGMLPSISMNGIGSFLLVFLIIILVASALGLFAWFFISKLKNNKTAIVYKKIGNVPTKINTFKARSERIGSAGDFLFFIPKIKKILPDPELQTGRNEYSFYIREDGEWINFAMGDFDKQFKEANAKYVHDDMRLQRLGIQKNLKERLLKDSFWNKYGNHIISVLYILVIMVCLIVMFNKMEKAWDKASAMSIVVSDMAKEVGAVASSIDNLVSKTSSGAIPVDSGAIPVDPGG